MSTPPPVAYYTSRMGFLIQAGSDKADYGTIIDALLKTDGASGLVLCTEATKPTTNNFPGKYIKCTDSLKHYYLDSSGTFTNGVYTGGLWVEDIYVNIVSVAAGNGNMFYSGNDSTVRTYTADFGSATASFGPYNSFNIATVNANQVVKFEIELQCSINLPTGYSFNNFDSYGPRIYLTIDGVDYLAGTVAIPLASVTYVTCEPKITRSVIVPTSGTHTVTYKLVNINPGGNSGSGSGITINIRNCNITATVSVT